MFRNEFGRLRSKASCSIKELQYYIENQFSLVPMRYEYVTMVGGGPSDRQRFVVSSASADSLFDMDYYSSLVRNHDMMSSSIGSEVDYKEE